MARRIHTVEYIDNPCHDAYDIVDIVSAIILANG